VSCGVAVALMMARRGAGALLQLRGAVRASPRCTHASQRARRGGCGRGTRCTAAPTATRCCSPHRASHDAAAAPTATLRCLPRTTRRLHTTNRADPGGVQTAGGDHQGRHGQVPIQRQLVRLCCGVAAVCPMQRVCVEAAEAAQTAVTPGGAGGGGEGGCAAAAAAAAAAAVAAARSPSPRARATHTRGQPTTPPPPVAQRHHTTAPHHNNTPHQHDSRNDRRGDVYTGSNWNILTLIAGLTFFVPLAGLLFAYLSHGHLWTGHYYGI
jgi:hypothetical protein